MVITPILLQLQIRIIRNNLTRIILFLNNIRFLVEVTIVLGELYTVRHFLSLEWFE